MKKKKMILFKKCILDENVLQKCIKLGKKLGKITDNSQVII